MEFWKIYIASVLITIIFSRGEVDRLPVILFSFIPFLGSLVAVFTLVAYFGTIISSKGKCYGGHKFIHTFDSEAEKWKNGRMLMRISVGGYDKYQCSRCQKEITKSWSAFD